MTEDADASVDRLTQAQVDCLMLVNQHMTSKQIAQRRGGLVSYSGPKDSHRTSHLGLYQPIAGRAASSFPTPPSRDG
jgi:hypothetical protein